MKEEEKKKITQVTNIVDALDVILQAAESGRKAGIFNFDELGILSQAVKLTTLELNKKITSAKLPNSVFVQEINSDNEKEVVALNLNDLTSNEVIETFTTITIDKPFTVITKSDQANGEPGDKILKLPDGELILIKVKDKKGPE
jgi:hypothetical protein